MTLHSCREGFNECSGEVRHYYYTFFHEVKAQGRSIFSGKTPLVGLLVPRLLSLQQRGRESQPGLGKQLGCHLFPDLQVNILDYRTNKKSTQQEPEVAGIFPTAFCWGEGGRRSTGRRTRGSTAPLALSRGERTFCNSEMTDHILLTACPLSPVT